MQVRRDATMLEQVLHDVLCRGTAAEQRVCLASTVAIDLAVPAARANASSVEANDGLIAIVDDLGVGIDANAARGIQHARGNAEGVERRGRDGPHVFCFFPPFGIGARVVLLDFVGQVIGIDANFLGEIGDGIGLEALVVSRDRLVDFVLQAIDGIADQFVGEAGIMTLAAAFGVFLNAVGVDDRPYATLSFNNLARNGGRRNVLVHETQAILVHPEIARLHGDAYAKGAVIAEIFHVIKQGVDREVIRAAVGGLLCHQVAVTVLALGLSALLVFAVGRWAIHLGMALGEIAALAFPSMMVAFCVSSIVILIVIAGFMFSDRDNALVFEPVEEGELDVETCEPDAEKPAQTKDERIAAVAEMFGLTARETEVFTLWATGHGAKSIEEKLVLSSATVRTHIRHIYEKLDVHSRAELIELLESRQRDPRVEIQNKPLFAR